MAKDTAPTARQQFAALPYRAGEAGLSVLLVTSRETGRWVLPKGWPEKDLDGAQTAALEAFEEAGLRGDVAALSIGLYRYAKRLADGGRLDCVVTVFPLRVGEILDDWPERAQRRRRWCSLAEAAALVEEAELAELFLRLPETGVI